MCCTHSMLRAADLQSNSGLQACLSGPKYGSLLQHRASLLQPSNNGDAGALGHILCSAQRRTCRSQPARPGRSGSCVGHAARGCLRGPSPGLRRAGLCLQAATETRNGEQHAWSGRCSRRAQLCQAVAPASEDTCSCKWLGHSTGEFACPWSRHLVCCREIRVLAAHLPQKLDAAGCSSVQWRCIPAQQVTAVLRAQGATVITGGVGALGCLTASWLSGLHQQGQQGHLWLLGRTGRAAAPSNGLTSLLQQPMGPCIRLSRCAAAAVCPALLTVSLPALHLSTTQHPGCISCSGTVLSLRPHSAAHLISNADLSRWVQV